MKLNYYKKKSIALEKLESNNILCNRGITNYFITNDYITFLNTIKKSKIKDYYEYIPKDKAVCFFFDIEIYKDESEFFEEYESILEKCYTSVATILGTSYNIKKIILESK